MIVKKMIVGKTITELLEAAVRKRHPLRPYTNALRLVNSIGDDLEGIVLEQYNRHFVAQIFDKRWLDEKEALVSFVEARCNGQYLVVKDRTESSVSPPDIFRSIVWIESNSSQTIVTENGLKFKVDLASTLNSGLFLDMRHNRKVVGELAKDAKVLNCFAYTCSFGVYCRAKGALNVVNVDISRKGLERGRANYELNQLGVSNNEFVCLDTAQYLRRAIKNKNNFDLIILDPPSFSRYDGKTFTVKKDFPKIIELAVKILNPNGFLFVATNFSAMSANNLKDMIREAVNKRQIKSIKRLGQDKDFPGSGLMQKSYLAALLVEF